MSDFNPSGFAHKRRQDELLKVAEQAAFWLIALEDGGARDRAQFAQWLEESPLHLEMFLRASSVDRMTELMAPEDLRTLSQKMWGAADAPVGWMVKNPSPLPPAPKGNGNKRRRRRLFSLAAAIVALICGAVWYGLFGPHAWAAYATSVGEQRALALADGSLIYVNTDTRVAVRYTKKAREVRLKSGEALFKVERDARRPFRVHLGGTVVQAVGTQFNIYRRSSETTVAVIEGVVKVSKGEDSGLFAPPLIAAQGASKTPVPTAETLAAGQAVSLKASGALATPVAVNVAQVTAWRQRRLVFEWQTLEEIATEFNRYNRAPKIRIEGEAVRLRRYTAVFDADSPQTLLRFLAQDRDLAFAAEGDDFVIRARGNRAAKEGL